MIRRDEVFFDKMQVKLNDTCRCGRSTQMIHCPNCGSTDIRVSVKLSAGATTFTPHGHEELPVRWFTCKRDAVAFSEPSCFVSCNAPTATWRREDNIANKIVPPIGQPLNEFQKDILAGLAKLRPDKAKTIADRLREEGPGLLERVDKSKDKLFEPPKLDEGGES